MAEMAKRTILLPLGGMDLETTLFCGQTFSWQKGEDGSFLGAVGGRAAWVCTRGDVLQIQPLGVANSAEADEIFWMRYFALEDDYAALHRVFAKDALLAQCVAQNPGIRVLRQPFWDTLLSFIISQNNHIPRIFGIVQRLRQGFGPQLDAGVWGFPAPEALAGKTPEDLAALQAGYRAKYLLDAARKVVCGTLSETALQKMEDGEARQALCTVNGVGPKVADCVLLFGLGRRAVAPMDVWMKRALADHFGGVFPPCATGNEGIAQQYIFHWARQKQRPGKKNDAKVDKN